MELSESNATVTWSLREELLLAFAVKRHGLKKWETVAMELQSRSNGFLFTAGICKEKYLNLRKRFKHNHAAAAAAGSGGDYDNNDVLESDGGGDGGGDGEGEEEKEEEEFWWLEELRKLRVAELKTEVQRYDLSIESLKTKMKTMEEEGDKSLNREAKMADLDEEKEAERSENDKNNGEKATSAEVAGNSGSGEDGNGSFNESNSTENTRTGLPNEPKPVDIKPNVSTLKPVQEDSCNDSSDSKEREREKDRVNSAELVNSSSESREGSHGTKGSSGDMQSSASQMTRRNKRNTKAGNGDGGVVAATPATVGLKKGHGGGGRKPEPMFGVLDVIRSHKNGYVFQRRLEIQKSRKYNDIIRRHVDLEMVQARIEDGSYSSCPAKIYVDLLLLLNNAIVFFPKSSSQSRVAHQLRQVVMNHVKKHSPKPSPPPDPLIRPERSDPLLAKQKSSAPIVVCKKRSNIVSKPSSSVVKIEKQADKKPDSNSKPNPKPSINKATLSTSNEEDGGIKSKTNEKPVTGVRSVRKGINVRPRLSPPPPPPPRNLSEKPESSKASKEKAAAEVNVVDKKKGAANFLKRIKKNEPAAQASGKKDQLIKKSDIKNDVGRSGGGGARRVKEENSVKTSDHVVQTATRRIGRPPKKGKEVLKGKRDRDGEEEGSLKRPMKRSRR